MLESLYVNIAVAKLRRDCKSLFWKIQNNYMVYRYSAT